jgi:hypothetical protein
MRSIGAPGPRKNGTIASGARFVRGEGPKEADYSGGDGRWDFSSWNTSRYEPLLLCEAPESLNYRVCHSFAWSVGVSEISTPRHGITAPFRGSALRSALRSPEFRRPRSKAPTD